MCSCRTYVPVIACILIPGFELRAALRKQPGLALRPAALAPAAGTEPLLGPVTAEVRLPAGNVGFATDTTATVRRLSIYSRDDAPGL